MTALTTTKRSPTALDEALKGLRGPLLAVAGFSLFVNLLMLVSPLYMMQVFDRVLGSGHGETLLYLTVIAGLALVCLGALETVRGRILARGGAWLERRLGASLIAAGLAASLAGRPAGTQPLRDLEQLRGFLGGTAMHPLFDAPWVPIYLAAIALLHPWLGLLALGAAVLLFALALTNELATRGTLRDAGQARVAALAHCGSALRNAEVLQALGLLPAVLRRWEADSEPGQARQLAAADVAALILGAAKFARLFVQVGVLALGAYLVLQDQLTAGGMIAGSILLGRALAPVEQAIGAWKSLNGARGAYGRLQALLRAAPRAAPAMALPPVAGRLSVEGATFVPPETARPVLRGVSFALEPGEGLALVGPSASGKSTLCRLLVGVWAPTAGYVRLDGAGVTSFDRAAFGRQIGYLPQDVELFDGTVRENIARLTEAEDAAVVEAAQRANVHEMILALPEGYHTRLGEGGAVLSGGQRQRIGLARALFGNPRLLVLDEPAANLDQAGEAALEAALAAARRAGATLVLVAHRLSQLGQVDRILVLNQGVVEQLGPRDEVLRRFVGPRPVPAARAAS